MKAIILGTAMLVTASAAHAQTCQQNFQVEGTPMLSALNYRSSEVFPNVSPAAAQDRAKRAMVAEGFSGIRHDRGVGALTAVQETSGSGRPQTLRVTVRKAGKGSRVDAVFMVQVGQIAAEGATRGAICRIIESVGG
ncbi:MAG: hypothetical protein ACRCTD_00760 [Beijerinckiaceae bacterium]